MGLAGEVEETCGNQIKMGSFTADDGDVGSAGGGGGSVVVGMKLGSTSRELLTWALVKVAQPGDRVVALHVLSNNEIVDSDGKSSLLSLVKAFDSVLGVYEGFCNLKQVDLKLKICRGTSVKKILVREAKAYEATIVIVGTARKHHSILFHPPIANYCSKKLPRACCVVAVNNGKIMFQRGPASLPFCIVNRQESKNVQESGSLLAAIHQSLSMNDQVVPEDGNASDSQKKPYELENGSLKLGSECAEVVRRKTCSVCSSLISVPITYSSSSSVPYVEESYTGDGGEGDSLAIVPAHKVEQGSTLGTLLTKDLLELKPGWPLLRRAVLTSLEGNGPPPSSGDVSVVRWTMQLPSRQASLATTSGRMDSISVSEEERSAGVDGDSSVGETSSAQASSECTLTSLPEELEGLLDKYRATCRLFNYQELVSATSNFAAENLIGRGGSSRVYRGCLPDGKKLAVKTLKWSEDALKEFVLEIEIITTLHHKNIISLFGFCFDDNHLHLIYDLLSRGSLEENLHGDKKGVLAFSWSDRYKVAVGVAEALDYLHDGADRSVIHGDVKSSNVLLSDDFEPQLSDFGLAKWASTSSSLISCSDVAGTFGYLAPEYFMYGKVNEKIDVYAFGVVLLELLTGKKPIDNENPKGQESLIIWVKPILNSGKIAQLLDRSLASNYDRGQMERMALAAKLCISRTPQARPKMSFVSKLLQGDAEVSQWARLQVDACDECDDILDDTPRPDLLQSHLNLALLDIEEDTLSESSTEQGISVEDYLKGRWSRASSFN